VASAAVAAYEHGCELGAGLGKRSKPQLYCIVAFRGLAVVYIVEYMTTCERDVVSFGAHGDMVRWQIMCQNIFWQVS